MKGLFLEKDLEHQNKAVENIVKVFFKLNSFSSENVYHKISNPIFNNITKTTEGIYQNQIIPSGQYYNNISTCQTENGIKQKPKIESNIIDIMMETGTGKTYTYTKSIFELNKLYNIFKFIIIVPTLSIKAGTITFLKSDSCREHFKELYNKTLSLYVVESQKSNKSNKEFMPSSIVEFVNAESFKNTIDVLIINGGMINSETLQKTYDKKILDIYSSPFEALAATKPFIIIDEPHKFMQSNKTWENIKKIEGQFILRFGATFQEYENLIYNLTAVDAFNANLVKGVEAHIIEFEDAKNAIVKLNSIEENEATFELIENEKTKTIKLQKTESMQKVHPELDDLTIDNILKNSVVLSNGLILKKGDKINPYAYAEKLQEIMIQKAIKNHFEIEKKFLKRDIKIKPLTLFFIDNIEEYRNKDGYLRKTLEACVEAEIKELLKTEQDEFYKQYLEKTLNNLSLTHAGYFSKDNTEKDEVIEKEIEEILHDKEALLDLENPRRFIFSKWTLKEGWDNPNIFQICKLRSSGSEISKIQEVGRGLRLPVNEFGNRVKDEQFFLNYFVDFTENDFVEKLTKEINKKSGILIDDEPKVLTEQVIKKICEVYKMPKEDFLILLDNNKVINRLNEFLPNGFEFLKQNFPQAFEGVQHSKIHKANEKKNIITIKTEKYEAIKELWEKLNEKILINYKINEQDLKELLVEFFKNQEENFSLNKINEKIAKIEVKGSKVIEKDSQVAFNRKAYDITDLKFNDFLKQFSEELNISAKILIQAIKEANIDASKYFNQVALRILTENFILFLSKEIVEKKLITYKKTSDNIHPTKLTDAEGNILNEIPSYDIGTNFSKEKTADSYLFNELYFDSDLEKINIKEEIEEVEAFFKIPKNSVCIPIADGRTYSPDFAYVIKMSDGTKKYLVIETKSCLKEENLAKEEKIKIDCAQLLFDDFIKFETQFENDSIISIVESLAGEN